MKAWKESKTFESNRNAAQGPERKTQAQLQESPSTYHKLKLLKAERLQLL